MWLEQYVEWWQQSMETNVGLGQNVQDLQLTGMHSVLSNQLIEKVLVTFFFFLPRIVLNSKGEMIELLDTILMSI